MNRLLRNIPIAPKILVAMGLLLSTMLIVAATAFWGFSIVRDARNEVEASGTRIEQSGRGTANLLSYARAVEFLPIEMPIAAREAFEKQVVDEAARFRRRLDQLEAGARQQAGRDDVAKMRQLLAQHEERGQRIRALSRDGAFDEAGKITSMRAFWSMDAIRPATAEDAA